LDSLGFTWACPKKPLPKNTPGIAKEKQEINAEREREKTRIVLPFGQEELAQLLLPYPLDMDLQVEARAVSNDTMQINAAT